jgi:hypothetical protein
VPEVRDTDADEEPVLVVEDVAGMSELARLGGISYVEAGPGGMGMGSAAAIVSPPVPTTNRPDGPWTSLSEAI